jgi:drug/metabolite transporter (DMT)-like permease
MLPWIALVVIWIVWGSTYLAIRIVVRELPPFAAAALRFAVAGAVMAVAAAFTDRAHGRPSRRQLVDYAIVGLLLLGVGNAFVMWSEQHIPSGIAALIVGAVPLWLTLMEGLRPGGQPWTLRAWLGVALGLAGVALVARPEGGVEGHWAGIAALQVACVSWSFGALYSQSVEKRLPVFSAAAIEMLAGSALLVVESRIAGEDLGAFALASGTAWAALAYLAVFGSLVGFTAFAFCLNELPATTVGTYAYVNPVVAVCLGSLFLGEPVSASLLAGAALILGAVVFTTTRPRPAAQTSTSAPELSAADC